MGEYEKAKNNLNSVLNKWNYEQDLLRKDREESDKFIEECDSEKLMIYLLLI
jgi:predicted house-cleaning noncanonical NTP pyrophosphatase (MazG superfamily)